MDMLTRDMVTELSTRSALRLQSRCSHRNARIVARPASASPMDEYTGDRDMLSSRFTSRTDACAHGTQKEAQLQYHQGFKEEVSLVEALESSLAVWMHAASMKHFNASTVTVYMHAITKLSPNRGIFVPAYRRLTKKSGGRWLRLSTPHG